MEKIGRIECHVIRVRQHRLSEINIWIPQRELAPGKGVNRNMPQRIVKIEDVPEIKAFRGKKGVVKKQNSQQNQQDRSPKVKVVKH